MQVRPLEAAYSLTFVQTSVISRSALFQITEHFPAARSKLRHAAAIYSLQLGFRWAWTRHKRMERKKGWRRASVSGREIHEGALQYSTGSAVLAAFAGAASVVPQVVSFKARRLKFQTAQETEEAEEDGTFERSASRPPQPPQARFSLRMLVSSHLST